MACSYCDYFEFWDKENSANFFYCRKESCEKAVCSICFNLVSKGGNDYEEESKGVYEEVVGTHEKHFDCFEHKNFRLLWDKAIEEGQTMKCPGCGNSGQKDDNCCHMTCDACETDFCYICETKFSEADGSK